MGKDVFISQMNEVVAICNNEDDIDYGVNCSRGTIVCSGNGFDFKFGDKSKVARKKVTITKEEGIK